jgi:hypothetical protein
MPPVWKTSCDIEALYRLEWLPLLRPEVSYGMFSSYDRTGGNNDGFRGTYSRLRLEDGNSVIAEMQGAGCITRIWFTHSKLREDGLLALKDEHIRIFLDGNPEPAVDVPLESLFSGKLLRFPKPLVGEALGGYVCYVPISYQNGCKVVIEGDDVHFYQITYSAFSDAQDMESFSMVMDSETEENLSKAAEFWSHPGDESLLGLTNSKEISEILDLRADETHTIDLPEGQHCVRAVMLEGDVENLGKAMIARLQFFWDGSSSPAADLPASYLFGQAFDPDPYQSLLAGMQQDQCYAFFPMPYRKNGMLRITASEPFSCRIRILAEKMHSKDGRSAYFHAITQKALPTQKDEYYTLLRTEGSGHYMGTYLVTEMETPQPLPEWLEGDERVFVNDVLLGHGTGTEDYFNCGWYAVKGRLNRSGAMPVHGFPVFRGNRQDGFTQAVAYRWHILDVIPFEGDLRIEIEHGPANDVPADYRSCAFVYLSSPVH